MEDLITAIHEYFREKQYTPYAGDIKSISALANEFDVLPEQTQFNPRVKTLTHSVFLRAQLHTLKDCDVLVGLLENMRSELGWLGDLALGALMYEALTGTKPGYTIGMRIEMTVSLCT